MSRRIKYPERREARISAMQILYGLEFVPKDISTAVEDFCERYPQRNKARAYLDTLMRLYTEHEEEINHAISASLASWTVDRVGKVEMAMLRVAVTELLYGSDVPPAVVMDEAIEITKQFAAEDAPRFINGLLDRIQTRYLAGEHITPEQSSEQF